MDRSSSLIALALVFWATFLACNCEKVSSKSYLKFPTDLSTDFHKNIAAALKKIVIKSSSMDWFDRALEAAEMVTDDEIDKQVYADVKEIGRGFLDVRLLATLLSICAQADKDLDSGLKPWKDYLAYTGRDYFSSFLRSTSLHGDWITRENTDFKLEMDRVFAATFNMRGDIRLQVEKLAEKLSVFDPAADQTFDAKNMIREIRSITNDRSTEDNFDLFKNFMLRRCNRFMAHEELREAIIRMDVLRYLYDSTMVDDSELERIDEYNRLCMALRIPESRALIRDNLNKRLKPNCFGF